MHLLQRPTLVQSRRGAAVEFERSQERHTKQREREMDQQQNNRNCSGKLLSAAAAAPATDWPAHDKPPHYYASQNSCNIKMISQPATHHRAQQQQQQQQQQTSLLDSIQRKLFTLLYIYAILIVSLYLTYAAYYFLQHQNTQQQQQRQAATSGKRQAQELRAGGDLQQADSNGLAATAEPPPTTTAHDSELPKLETKLHLLERYMELIAIDLQETKEKLREREKCDCSVGCHFNGTRYEDRSSWQNQCDICTCQVGKISCQPKKCPPVKCDHSVTLPGQCCPTCMRQCKYNKQLIRHGDKFNPVPATASVPRSQTKVCQCFDGRIKCEPVAAVTGGGGAKTTATRVSSNGGLVQTTTTTTTYQPQADNIEDGRKNQITERTAAPAKQQVAAKLMSSTSVRVDPQKKATTTATDSTN